MPQPASSAPPPIAATSAVGTIATAYAKADHTHASSVQTTQGLAVPAGTGPVTVTWTYPNATLFSAPPVVLAQAVVPGTATAPIVVDVIQGSVTATQCKFLVWASAPVTVSILGASVNAFAGSIPAGITLNCYAHS